MIKKLLIGVTILAITTFAAGCGSNDQTNENTTHINTSQQRTDTDDKDKGNEAEPVLTIDGEQVEVKWEDNESVKALFELAVRDGLKIEMNRYGGFEQVGDVGSDLPSNDLQITTETGDIVLYKGNQMVIFYGSNSWEYTSLGKITGKTTDELQKLLDKDTTTVTLEMK